MGDYGRLWGTMGGLGAGCQCSLLRDHPQAHSLTQSQRDGFQESQTFKFKLSCWWGVLAPFCHLSSLLLPSTSPGLCGILRPAALDSPALSSLQSYGSSGTPATCRVPGYTRHLSLTVGVLPGGPGEGVILGESTPPAPPGPLQGCGTASGPRSNHCDPGGGFRL